MRFLSQPRIRIVLVYLIDVALWIWLSDRAIVALFDSPAAITRAQNIGPSSRFWSSPHARCEGSGGFAAERAANQVGTGQNP